MFVLIAAIVVAAVVSVAMAPKPVSVDASGLDEFQVPTVEAGRNFPVLFGTKLVKSPMVVWYGDLRSTAIKK